MGSVDLRKLHRLLMFILLWTPLFYTTEIGFRKITARNIKFGLGAEPFCRLSTVLCIF